MKRPKVSIIMPCYNGSETIAYALRGVIGQTYRPIELILVNDGSTDNTDEVIKTYEVKLKEAAIDFKYICQENKGLGGAINTGLKHVSGEYLAWVDADDELYPSSVEKRLRFLELHPDFGSVSSNASIANDSDWDNPIGLLTNDVETNSDPAQFEHLLMSKSIFCSGCHLIRTSVFNEANGGMDIYPARHGQNWQMLLPVYYASKHAFINEPLYKYRVNAQNNMSSQIRTMSLKKMCGRRNEYVKIVTNTLNRIHTMKKDQRRHYINKFKKHMCELNLDMAVEQEKIIDVMIWKAIVKLVKALRY